MVDRCPMRRGVAEEGYEEVPRTGDFVRESVWLKRFGLATVSFFALGSVGFLAFQQLHARAAVDAGGFLEEKEADGPYPPFVAPGELDFKDKFQCHAGGADAWKSWDVDHREWCCAHHEVACSFETCNPYLKKTGCGWTKKYPCPGQPKSSEFQWPAHNDREGGWDHSEGWECCCVRGGWKPQEEQNVHLERYEHEASYEVKQPIAENIPVLSSGTVESFHIKPALPGGLKLDAKTGVIDGTPTEPLERTKFTVMAVGKSSTSRAVINLKVYEKSPFPWVVVLLCLASLCACCSCCACCCYQTRLPVWLKLRPATEQEAREIESLMMKEPEDPSAKIIVALEELDCPAKKGWYVRTGLGNGVLARCGGGSHTLTIADVSEHLEQLGISIDVFSDYYNAKKSRFIGKPINELLKAFMAADDLPAIQKMKGEHEAEIASVRHHNYWVI
eukprot:TRINITY_DN17790_c0_g1_i1.p1 TRINITY_DN17790_c0_g1~~TRINITY_DN17790_c0_g1_i1.p1  ORF type:complete len:446 (-),score=92.28 TRINITY_DN17790_c0_g1_i1:166-1503(-)